MQLTRSTPLRSALAAATYSLLATDPAHGAFFDFDSPWEVDAAVLFYSEQKRVAVIEPVAQVKKEIGAAEFLTARFTYDSMSGATPNGALPTDTAQTFTSPSGETTHTTAAHDLPMINFEDARAAVSVDWERPLMHERRAVFGANFSRETDYTSLGLSTSLLWDLHNKLTTLSAGASVNFDVVNPTGGAPVPLSTLSAQAAADESDGKSKQGYEVLIGVTQVLTRQTLMQLNYVHGAARGYLTDPYKAVSVVNAGSGATSGYVHEKRPASRARNILFWKTVHQFNADVVHVSYRYYRDDWEVRSHTVDLSYRFEFNAKHSLEPHWRYYTQTAAHFFTHSVKEGVLPTDASADLRLADFESTTLGLRYAYAFGEKSEIGIAVDHMKQSGDAHPSAAIGVQKNENLFPDLNATSIFADFSIQF